MFNFFYILGIITKEAEFETFITTGRNAAARCLEAAARRLRCKNPGECKRVFRTASILPNNRIVFNIKGNNFRLIAAVNYDFGIVYIRFIGKHSEYDKINAEEI